jgi:hypothetical protein
LTDVAALFGPLVVLPMDVFVIRMINKENCYLSATTTPS